MSEQIKQKSPQAGAYASILLAATLWGIIGLWNRRLMAAGLSPTSIVVVRNFGGMALLAAYRNVRDKMPLEDFLEQEVFAGAEGVTLQPDADEVAAFREYLSRYQKALALEHCAVETV